MILDELQQLKRDYFINESKKNFLKLLFKKGPNHAADLDRLIRTCESEKENPNDIYITLRDSFDAGARKYFPDSYDRTREFINKLNAEPNKHFFYRGIGMIIKNNFSKIPSEFYSLETSAEVLERKHQPPAP